MGLGRKQECLLLRKGFLLEGRELTAQPVEGCKRDLLRSDLSADPRQNFI